MKAILDIFPMSSRRSKECLLKAPRADVSTSTRENMVLPGVMTHPDYTYDACSPQVFLDMILSSKPDPNPRCRCQLLHHLSGVEKEWRHTPIAFQREVGEQRDKNHHGGRRSQTCPALQRVIVSNSLLKRLQQLHSSTSAAIFGTFDTTESVLTGHDFTRPCD